MKNIDDKLRKGFDVARGLGMGAAGVHVVAYEEKSIGYLFILWGASILYQGIKGFIEKSGPYRPRL